MKRKIWISVAAGAILVVGTAANMSDNPSQSQSEDSVVINDWLIVGEPGSSFTPGEGSLSLARGRANGDGSFASGTSVFANGDGSFASGTNVFANGDRSSAVGAYVLSRGDNAHARGRHAYAYGGNSTAIGFGVFASGYASLAVGEGASADGSASVALGSYSNTFGLGSIAMGVNTTAYGRATAVVGEYNESLLADSSNSASVDNADGHLFVVGNGFSESDRSNAMVVYHDGSVDVGKNDTDDTVPLQVTSDGSVILARAQGDISMGAFGNGN